MTSIELTLPLRLVNPLNNRRHWRSVARTAKVNRGATLMALRVSAKSVALPCVVTITRISAGSLDCDNLAASGKNVRDGIADALNIDDRDPRVTWRYSQERGPRKQYAVRIMIEW